MSKYILSSVAGNSLEEMDKTLKESICFPLVREIEFKYGLKVYKILSDRFYLCYPNGLPCGTVFARRGMGTHVEHWEYHFTTPYYKKARASSNNDRHTVSSKKISTLMGTIQRQKVIKDVTEIFKNYKYKIADAKEIMIDSFGRSNKYESVSMETIHALVAHALGENPNSYGLSLDLHLCKILLDKFNKADSIKAEKIKESDRFFSNPFYAIGVDTNKHIIIGKFTLVGDVMTIIEDFSRVKSLDHKEDLTAILTMMRVANEGRENLSLDCFINSNVYDADLDVIYKNVHYHDETDFQWTLIPCQ
jgi:CTP-dependent riboflavin kinase